MKLFQQMLVAPAALGLLAPLAANAADLNLQEVSNYASSSKSVKSISKFSDVYPTDWAFQALTNLVERHGCSAMLPNGSITRYEAAALLNKCISSVSQANDEERALINEFGSELAVIQGRADSLETGTAEFEAGMFSTTTKVSGETIFVVGAISTEKATAEGEDNASLVEDEALNFVYHTAFSIDTSFNGDDLLHTSLEAGNFRAGDPFSATGNAPLEATYESSSALEVGKIYYQFPIGDFTVTAGPKIRQDDMLPVWPNSYPADTILDSLTYAGATAAYSLAEGAGAGVSYANGGWNAALLFVSEAGGNADPTAGGILTSGGSDDITGQIAWTGEGITVAAVYTIADGGVTDGSSSADDYEAWGISGSWQPNIDSVFVPSSISAGFGSKSVDKETKYEGDLRRGHTDIMDEVTWSVGLEWSDFIVDGNTLGLGLGSAEGWRDESTYSDPMAYELFYSMAVSDNITVTPAIFQVERDDDYAVTGGLVKTTFSF